MEFSFESFKTKRFIIAALFIVQVFIIYILSLQLSWHKEKLKNSRKSLRILNAELEYLKSSIPQTDKLDNKRSLLTGSQLKLFTVKGLKNPVKNIVIDIMRHNELIPHKGVVGGKMGFYDAKEIYILSNKWVFASFDDGHLSGKMLLEYNVSDKGTISWKVISSYLN